ncbi:PREDICTED: phospholipase A-2-activating protein [Nicrophorus vespilloides]|uniref:Phospholipase A-2-activating protein n=1 Tax=Nicrophorus vespilloides TaxID=110193 RepID=A0ABM1MB79_NICVS|nr:PREDICTED: phospholipase A-2-activating protein [Nicrophorus vespilloides]
MTKPFKLSSVLFGHSSDVRSVFAGPDNSLISGSRDKTAKFWQYNGSETGYTNTITFKNQRNFVASVIYLKPTSEYPDGLVISGGNDNSILIYKANQPTAIFQLKEHTDAVCNLSVGPDPGTFFSGSWDATAKLWSLAEKPGCVATYDLHQAAVWSIISLSNGNVASGSADRTIMIWTRSGEKIKQIKGHTDCVRGLVDFPEHKYFLSASNDATIRTWNYSGENLNTLYGHTNYIYSISRNLAVGTDCFVTSDEDYTVRFWYDGRNTQSIKLPARSVWSVTCLTNGDIAAGASDGIIRIFTQDETRVAGPEVLKQFEDLLAEVQKQNQDEIGGYKVSDLCGPEALFNPGKTPGEIKMIREGGYVVAYNWVENGDASHWEKVGEVLGANDKGNAGKTMFEGKEYDYVFSVDVEDGKPPLKLPFNKGEDVYVAAQKFLSANMLPAEYLEQVVEFILKNSNESAPMALDNHYVDPFTGASRYTPTSAYVPNADNIGGVNYDPLTGGSSYTTSTDQSSSAIPPLRVVNDGVNMDPITGGSSYSTSGRQSEDFYFPQSSYIRFDMGDPQVILNKLKEFNQTIDEPNLRPVEEEIILKIGDLCNQPTDEENVYKKLFELLFWPDDKVFPVIDVIRLAIRDKKNNNIISQMDNGVILDKLKMCIGEGSHVANNRIVAYRALCNLFQHRSGEQLVFIHRVELLKMIFTVHTSNKNVQVGLATFILNLIIMVIKRQDEFGMLEIADKLPDTLVILSDPEAQFRAFVGMGTLISCENKALNKEVKRIIQGKTQFCKTIRDIISVQGNSEVEIKRNKCASQVDKELLL